MPTDREYDLSIAGLDMNGHGPPSPRRGHDPRDGVAEMTLGVGDFDYDFEGCSRAVPGPVGGYGPREEARAQNADAAMQATRQTCAWRLCWETPTFGAISTEPIDWTGGANPTDRLVTEARALATCLRHPVDIQYRRHGGGWALWDIARPIETCRGGSE
jgi:hypothetical protein